MDRFLSLEAFVRVAECHSFAAAARQLGVTRSVITSRIQQLEKQIQAPLFHRSTRYVRLSEVGETYYQSCADLVAQVTDLTDQMREGHAGLTGRLRLQMLPGFGLTHFAPYLAGFTRQHPEIQLDIHIDDQLADPIEAGYDVVFQMFPPLAESLISRPLVKVRRLFCASPRYLAQHGAPRQPDDLRQHAVALYSGYPSRNRWTFRQADQAHEVELPGQVRTNSVQLLLDYALQDAAIVCLPSMVASAALLDGTLQPVLADYDLSSFTLAAVYPQTQRQALKVSLLVDYLAQQLRGEPAWDAPLLARGWLR